MLQTLSPIMTMEPQFTLIVRMLTQEVLAKRLANLRAEWITATGGDLESVTVNLALLFDDLAAMLELPNEREGAEHKASHPGTR